MSHFQSALMALGAKYRCSPTQDIRIVKVIGLCLDRPEPCDPAHATRGREDCNAAVASVARPLCSLGLTFRWLLMEPLLEASAPVLSLCSLHARGLHDLGAAALVIIRKCSPPLACTREKRLCSKVPRMYRTTVSRNLSYHTVSGQETKWARQGAGWPIIAFSPVLPSLHFVARNVPRPQYSEFWLSARPRS